MATNRRFKRLTKEEYAEAIEWYQQQSALWHLGYGEQLALLNSVSPNLYEGWLADVSQNLNPDLPACVVSRQGASLGYQTATRLSGLVTCQPSCPRNQALSTDGFRYACG